MKRACRHPPPGHRQKHPHPALSRSKALIRLDTDALRRKSLRDYRKAEQNLECLKSQLKHFHEIDSPGFRTWLHQTFGPLLTRQRELARAIHEKQSLLLEIEDMADRYRLSDAAAYRKVLWRRAHPEEAQAEDLQFEEEWRRRKAQRDRPSGKSAGPWDDPAFPGGDEADGDFDSIPDDAWDDFSDFFEAATGQPPPRRSARLASKQEERSARDLYRTIVRRLHPDHHGAMSEKRQNLWHEAQAAYRRRDLAALYDVLARCETGDSGPGPHTPISLIRRLTAQLRQAIHSARSEIKRMKTDPAWNHAERARDPRHVNRLRSELLSVIRMAEHDLRSLDSELERLERQAKRLRHRAARHPPPRSMQDEFPF